MRVEIHKHDENRGSKSESERESEQLLRTGEGKQRQTGEGTQGGDVWDLTQRAEFPTATAASARRSTMAR